MNSGVETRETLAPRCRDRSMALRRSYQPNYAVTAYRDAINRMEIARAVWWPNWVSTEAIYASARDSIVALYYREGIMRSRWRDAHRFAVVYHRRERKITAIALFAFATGAISWQIIFIAPLLFTSRTAERREPALALSPSFSLSLPLFFFLLHIADLSVFSKYPSALAIKRVAPFITSIRTTRRPDVSRKKRGDSIRHEWYLNLSTTGKKCRRSHIFQDVNSFRIPRPLPNRADDATWISIFGEWSRDSFIRVNTPRTHVYNELRAGCTEFAKYRVETNDFAPRSAHPMQMWTRERR